MDYVTFIVLLCIVLIAGLSLLGYGVLNEDVKYIVSGFLFCVAVIVFFNDIRSTMTEMMKASIAAIKNWCYWETNWGNPEVWIPAIWGNGCDGRHFMEKFIGECDSDMGRFYRELSSDNQDKLAEYVMTHYNCGWK